MSLPQSADWPWRCPSGTLRASSLRGALSQRTLSEVTSLSSAFLRLRRRCRRHALQRGRWAAERAYRPDPRALAALCSQRAEMLRLEQGPERAKERSRGKGPHNPSKQARETERERESCLYGSSLVMTYTRLSLLCAR